jgi:cupin superfamily acireductone dioxygenase involved in methionine salvage
MVIGNPSQGDENADIDIWLKRQFAWDPADFGGDIDATVDAWYADTVERFSDRTAFSWNDVVPVQKLTSKFGRNVSSFERCHEISYRK